MADQTSDHGKQAEASDAHDHVGTPQDNTETAGIVYSGPLISTDHFTSVVFGDIITYTDRPVDQDESSAAKGRLKPATSFQCNLCPKRFSRAYNLRSHLRTHTDERPFVCTVCGKGFARQHDRKRHEGLHSGEKKFICRGEVAGGPNTWGCGRRFARADALARHFRSEAGRLCIKPLLDANDQYPIPENIDANSLFAGPNAILPSALLHLYPALANIPRSEIESSFQEFDAPGTSYYDTNFDDDGFDGYNEFGKQFIPPGNMTPASSIASLNTFHDSAIGTSHATSSKAPGSTATGGVSFIAKQELLLLLGGNDALSFLFGEAVGLFSKERFIRNVRRLLLIYSSELSREKHSGRNSDALRILRYDSEWFATRFYEAADPNHISSSKDMDSILEQNVEKLPVLENFFRTTLPEGSVSTLDPTFIASLYKANTIKSSNDEQADTESNISDFPEDMDVDVDYSEFPNLEHVKAFLLDGQAFADFEMRLANFVYPDRVPQPRVRSTVPHSNNAGDQSISLEETLDTKTSRSQSFLKESLFDLKLKPTSDELLRETIASESSGIYSSTPNTSLRTSDANSDLDNFDHLLTDEQDSDSSESDPTDERFSSPYNHLRRLADIQENVMQGSGLLGMHTDDTRESRNDIYSQSLSVPWLRILDIYPDFDQRISLLAEDLKVGKDSIDRLTESIKLILGVFQSVSYLRKVGYGTGDISLLFEEDATQNVVFLRRVMGKDISRLYSTTLNIYDDPDLSRRMVWQLAERCQYIDVGYSYDSEATGIENAINIIYSTSLILSVGVISYAGAHIVRTTENSHDSRFDLSRIDLRAKICCQKRKLQCMDDFLGGKEVWVFSTKNPAQHDSRVDDKRLLLSANPQVLADVWGPLWEVTDSSDQILRYEIGNGWIVPWNPPSDMKVPYGEIFCHWQHSKDIDDEFIKATQSRSDIIFKRDQTLLIGAVTGLTANSKCQPATPDFLRVKSKLEAGHAIGVPGATSSRRFADSHGITAQASIFNLVNVGGTVTYKRQSGTTMKDDLVEKWQDPKLRNSEDLECNGGLLVSICTRNAMRATIRDVLYTRTMKFYLESIAFSWISRECKTTYFASLRSRKAFRKFWFGDERWRQNAGEAIYLCLRRLECTGVDVDNRELNVLWVESFGQSDEDDDTDSDSGSNSSSGLVPPPTEELLVKLFRSEFGWTGLVANSMDCLTMAVMTTVCLEYDRGRRCRGIKTVKRKSDPILQTKLCVNESLMKEKKIAPENGKLGCHGIWKSGSFAVGDKLYLGSHGNIEVLDALSNCACHHSSLEVEWHPVLSEKVLELKDVAKNEIIMGRGVEKHHWEYMKGVSLHMPLKLLVLPR